jgi:hypothetical protein
VNVEALRETVNNIEAVVRVRPSAFDMSEWCEADACGTVACFAGWAMTSNEQAAWLRHYDFAKSPWQIACDRFDLTKGTNYSDVGEDDRLFLMDQWPVEFRQQYYAAAEKDDALGKVQALRDRVEHFIATDGRE